MFPAIAIANTSLHTRSSAPRMTLRRNGSTNGITFCPANLSYLELGECIACTHTCPHRWRSELSKEFSIRDVIDISKSVHVARQSEHTCTNSIILGCIVEDQLCHHMFGVGYLVCWGVGCRRPLCTSAKLHKFNTSPPCVEKFRIWQCLL